MPTRSEYPSGIKGLSDLKRRVEAAQAQAATKVTFGIFGPAARKAIANEFGIGEGVLERPAFRMALRRVEKDMADAIEAERKANFGLVRKRVAAEIGWKFMREYAAIINQGQELPKNYRGTRALIFTQELLKSIDVKVE